MDYKYFVVGQTTCRGWLNTSTITQTMMVTFKTPLTASYHEDIQKSLAKDFPQCRTIIMNVNPVAWPSMATPQSTQILDL
jgi:hypothetical protein